MDYIEGIGATIHQMHMAEERQRMRDRRITELQATLSEQESTAARQLEALTMEVAGLKGRFDKDQERIKTQAEYLAAAQDEIERLKVDAERYRWLREADQTTVIRLTHYCFEALDKAIDAARQGEREEGK